MTFKPGQRVVARDPEAGEEFIASFLRVGDPDEVLEIPLGTGTRKADAAWVELDDGTLSRVVYSQLRAAPEAATDLREYDPALLVVLLGEGSMEDERFLETSTFDRSGDDEWPLPRDRETTRAWRRHAVERGLVKRDDEGWVNLTQAGRDRLEEFR